MQFSGFRFSEREYLPCQLCPLGICRQEKKPTFVNQENINFRIAQYITEVFNKPLDVETELNSLCYMIDKDFPNPRKKPKELKIYCQQHPYYFIDKLRHELVVNLFCQHLEDRLDLLIRVAQKTKTEDLDSIEAYLDNKLGL